MTLHRPRAIAPVAVTVAVAVVAFLAASVVATPARADNWLANHAVAEVTGGVAWRVAIGADPRAPGFSALTVGGEAWLGLEVGAGFAILFGARGRYGAVANLPYSEVAGSTGLQWHPLERVRVRLGADGGRLWIDDKPQQRSAGLAGGWLELGLDIITIGGRSALSLSVRLDLGAFIDPPPTLPIGTLSLSTGLGGRY